jgi:Zn-dependent M28 family amino/carboxypeptidase
MKRLFIILCLFATSAYGQTVDEIKNHVSNLCKTERVTGTPGCKTAATYIQEELSKLGYSVELQPFQKDANNLLVTKKAPLDTIMVIGAHYDAVKGTPGADDNASGTAGVLMLAKMLKDRTTRHTISIQFYAGQEQGLIGSTYYCKHPKWPIDKHLFMLNLDMIGYAQTKGLAAPKPPVDDVLLELFKKYPFAKSITFRSGPGSDHESFAAFKIPVVFLHTGLHGNYHKASDTPDKLNYAGMVNICKYAMDLILVIDKYDVPNYSMFEKLPMKDIPR